MDKEPKRMQHGLSVTRFTGHKFGLRIDQLWIVSILAVFGTLIALTPIPPNDFWWHLKVGDVIASTGKIPRTNMFAWTVPVDKPFLYAAWFGDYILYGLYRIGGVSLIAFTRTILAVIAFGMIALLAKRRSGSWRLAAVAVTLAGVMSANNFEVRPQMWVWVLFAIFYYILSIFADRQIRSGWLFVLPVLMVFWVNVHGSSILGPVLVLLFFVGEGIQWFNRSEGALPKQAILTLGAVGVLCLLAMLINPEFIGIFRYIFSLTSDKAVQSFILEWQSPTPNSYYTIMFFASILLLIGLLGLIRVRITPTELLLCVTFLWLAFTGIRNIIWYAMLVAPILARLASEIGWVSSAIKKPVSKNVLNLILSGMICVPFIFVQPWFIDQIPLPDSYWNLVLHDNKVGPMLSTGNPIGAANYLQEHPGGKLFNEMAYGSYLIWAIPDQGVFIDPRIELYPYDQWLDYIKIMNGIHYNDLLGKYGADRLMLNSREQQELIGLLAEDPLWEREYQDGYSEIWKKGR